MEERGELFELSYGYEKVMLGLRNVTSVRLGIFEILEEARKEWQTFLTHTQI